MPSSKNYVRNYAEEMKTAKARGEDKEQSVRHKARREAVKLGMVKPKDGKDVDHITPLVKGGSGLAPSNLRARSEHDNRSFKRTKKAGMV
jgi:hypothetical protein